MTAPVSSVLIDVHGIKADSIHQFMCDVAKLRGKYRGGQADGEIVYSPAAGAANLYGPPADPLADLPATAREYAIDARAAHARVALKRSEYDRESEEQLAAVEGEITGARARIYHARLQRERFGGYPPAPGPVEVAEGDLQALLDASNRLLRERLDGRMALEERLLAAAKERVRAGLMLNACERELKAARQWAGIEAALEPRAIR